MAPDIFIEHFSTHYQDRWPALYASLQKPEIQVARLNAWAEGSFNLAQKFEALSGCYQWQSEAVLRSENDLLQFYVMDPASILAARALDVQDGDMVLDLCAAPGGKTLILIEALKTAGEITANELSAPRRERLKKVIQQYVPRDIRNRVWVSGKEGGSFGVSARNRFDRILVDTPCSGERHLLETPKELSEWTPARSQKLAQRQYALVTAALEAAKPGGRIVYSTCSISRFENEDVIARLLKKKSDRVREVQPDLEILGEKLEHGQIFLPDQYGFGPIYLCALEKI